ncbi:MAG: CoA-transferase [Candidatus Kariarchaeaceae archaeon]|jgi:acyl CoA:acetate/3-ketoacid CoA transferase alpha subunit
MSKLATLDLIDQVISSGHSIAIGGVHSHNVPMAMIRQIIKSEKKNLTLVGSISAGLPIDILVGTGCVSRVLAPYVGFEMWGLAPKFREAVQDGSIEAPDVCEAFPIYSLRAAAEGLPFHPFPPGIHDHTSIPSQSEYYKKVRDPFTGEEVYALRALKPDVALIHVQEATRSGHGIHLGSVVSDRLMAEASQTVFLTCDRLVEESDMDPNSVTIPSFMVDHVIPLEYGAHPTSSHKIHGYDAVDIKAYLQASRDPTSYQEFVQSRLIDHTNYISNFVNSENLGNLGKMAEIPTIPTVSERIAVFLSREISDNEVGICGAVAAIPMAALILAERTHAPGMKWIAGGSGYVNPRGDLVPSSTDLKMAVGAETKLSMHEVIPIEMDKIDFFFAGGLQIDARGNANLAGLPSVNGWKLRGPGSVGLPFLARAGKVFLYTENHSVRSLVDKVSYISGPGHVGERRYGEGPQVLITDKCIFRWNRDLDGWQLYSLHEGYSIEDIKEVTGFDFDTPIEVATTAEPTDNELKLLREIDPTGYLRGASD